MISNAKNIHARSLCAKCQMAHQLKEFQVDKDGSYIRAIPNKGEGDCLFYSLSQHLHGNPDAHMDVRKNVVNFVTDKYFKATKDTLLSTHVDFDYQSVEEYREYMGSPFIYSGDYELTLFMQIYDSNVLVYTQDEQDESKVKISRSILTESDTSDTIELLFSMVRNKS